ncbi:MAG: hypothetical protein V4662_27000 [Verrucomicrobiota bacterium]
MKLLSALGLLSATLLTSCAGPYDYPYSGYSGYNSPPRAYNTSYPPASPRPMRSPNNDNSAWAQMCRQFNEDLRTGGPPPPPRSQDYERCELCSEPVGFSGRWCDQHASVVQERMNQGR